MIIVIDGPAGSGKSSTARTIARKLGIQFLDSGALYRALTYVWIKSGKVPMEKFFDMLSDISLQTHYKDETFFVEVNSKDITEEIRKQDVVNTVSDVASVPEIRKFVNRYMRNLVKKDLFIADGRDLGTAVFPDAELKFYMDASIEERAQRRYTEMVRKDSSITLQDVKENLTNRDNQDKNRDADPLKKAEDAILIDTTGLTFEEQTLKIIEIIHNRLKL
tara:strand:+ start:7017 stop:7676 length:660 start_codon:yes stop_codon:yes gene_type:complete